MKKNTFFAIISSIVLGALLPGCDPYGYDSYTDPYSYDTSSDVLSLRNFSSDTTVWYIPDRESALGTLPAELSEWQKIAIFEILPHSTYYLSFDSGDNYVTPLETYQTTDALSIYVFKKADWRTHTWEELIQNELWCYFGTYTVEQAVAANCTITYPIQ